MSNLLCFHDFVVVVLFDYTQLQNADILLLVADSAAVFMSMQVPYVISGKNTYGHIPHHSLIICCSPRSLNRILQVVMHEEEKQFPIKTQTLQMSAVKHKTVNKSFNLIRSGKDTYPNFYQRVVM